MSNLEAAFTAEMEQTYRIAAKHGYRATYFLKMIGEHGAVNAAKILLAKDGIAEGLMRLSELGLLDTSMEAIVLKPAYAELFSPAERARARERLAALNHRTPWDREDS